MQSGPARLFAAVPATGSAPIGWEVTGTSGHTVQADVICAK